MNPQSVTFAKSFLLMLIFCADLEQMSGRLT